MPCRALNVKKQAGGHVSLESELSMVLFGWNAGRSAIPDCSGVRGASASWEPYQIASPMLLKSFVDKFQAPVAKREF